MAQDNFTYRQETSDPFTNAFAVTPNDSTDLDYVTRGIYIGGSGDVVVITKGGDEVTLVNTLAGTYLPIRVSRIKSTGTTATNILGLY